MMRPPDRARLDGVDLPFTIYERTFLDSGHTVYRVRGRDGHLVSFAVIAEHDNPRDIVRAYQAALGRPYIRRGRSTPPRL